MEETISQMIRYLRDVLNLSFYQIQDRTGISRKRASRIYRECCPERRQRRDFILGYSRYLFAHVFARSSFEFFIEGHLMAFCALGGIPYGIRYDNLSTVVLKRRPQLQYNPRFLEFSRYYNLEIRLRNPGAGNEKGRVERVIRTLRETFFNTLEKDSSLNGLNHALHEWVNNKNHTLHRVTEKKPAELLE